MPDTTNPVAVGDRLICVNPHEPSGLTLGKLVTVVEVITGEPAAPADGPLVRVTDLDRWEGLYRLTRFDRVKTFDTTMALCDVTAIRARQTADTLRDRAWGLATGGVVVTLLTLALAIEAAATAGRWLILLVAIADLILAAAITDQVRGLRRAADRIDPDKP